MNICQVIAMLVRRNGSEWRIEQDRDGCFWLTGVEPSNFRAQIGTVFHAEPVSGFIQGPYRAIASYELKDYPFALSSNEQQWVAAVLQEHSFSTQPKIGVGNE